MSTFLSHFLFLLPYQVVDGFFFPSLSLCPVEHPRLGLHITHRFTYKLDGENSHDLQTFFLRRFPRSDSIDHHQLWSVRQIELLFSSLLLGIDRPSTFSAIFSFLGYEKQVCSLAPLSFLSIPWTLDHGRWTVDGGRSGLYGLTRDRPSLSDLKTPLVISRHETSSLAQRIKCVIVSVLTAPRAEMDHV